MSKDLEKAIKILEDMLPLPKGKDEALINVGIRIARNAIMLEIQSKKLKEIEDELSILNLEIDYLSQEKQGL